MVPVGSIARGELFSSCCMSSAEYAACVNSSDMGSGLTTMVDTTPACAQKPNVTAC